MGYIPKRRNSRLARASGRLWRNANVVDVTMTHVCGNVLVGGVVASFSVAAVGSSDAAALLTWLCLAGASGAATVVTRMQVRPASDRIVHASDSLSRLQALASDGEYTSVLAKVGPMGALLEQIRVAEADADAAERRLYREHPGAFWYRTSVHDEFTLLRNGDLGLDAHDGVEWRDPAARRAIRPQLVELAEHQAHIDASLEAWADKVVGVYSQVAQQRLDLGRDPLATVPAYATKPMLKLRSSVAALPATALLDELIAEAETHRAVTARIAEHSR